jgi:hypothetical protein
LPMSVSHTEPQRHRVAHQRWNALFGTLALPVPPKKQSTGITSMRRMQNA